MRICLLTYDTAHLKTSQVFHALLNRGLQEVDFMAMPFTARPARGVLLQHRPKQFNGPLSRSIAEGQGRAFLDYENWREHLEVYDHFIVCGSNLIDREFANSGKILNVHSGLIPAARGLDSFKWAILRGLPMGNTLHQVDEFADAGVVLAHLRTPLYHGDTLASFASRHYENEIWMLGNFDRLMSAGKIEPFELNEATMRMPMAREEHLPAAFERYKDKFAVG